jgi:beta-lactamase class A
MSRRALAAMLCVASIGCAGAQLKRMADEAAAHMPPPAPRPPDPLVAVFEKLEPETGGTLGVAILHVESGRRASWRGDERFPMASVFKLPTAIRVLLRVDRGEVSLDQTVTIGEHDLRPSWSPLGETFHGTPLEPAVRELVRRMLCDSDNTAADALLALAGGPRAVTECMRDLGILAIDVSRDERELNADGAGVRELPPPSEYTVAKFNALAAAVPPEERQAAQARYAVDGRDTVTPDAMVDLLLRVHRRDCLKPETAAFLVDCLEHSTTGARMIRAGVPAGATVADKSGGMAGTRNDVGIVTLPNGAGHVLIAAFVKGSSKPFADREAAIAKTARAVCEAMMPAPAQ